MSRSPRSSERVPFSRAVIQLQFPQSGLSLPEQDLQQTQAANRCQFRRLLIPLGSQSINLPEISTEVRNGQTTLDLRSQ